MIRMSRTGASRHLEIFALFPIRHFGLEALDLGVLDVDVVVGKSRPQRLVEERIVLQRGYRFPQGLRQQDACVS